MTGSPSPLPSFQEQHSSQNPVLLNPDSRRLCWTLNGPLETAITVIDGYFFNSDKMPEPYYGGSVGGDGNPLAIPNWHPIFQLPLTEPKVSSLRLRVDPLDQWDYYWMENHEGHSEPDETYDPAEVLYGPMPDADEGENDFYGRDSHLIVCCGQKRPRGKGTQLVVKAGSPGGFVTIHDFVSAVHPYLMGRRDDILGGMNEEPGRTGKPFRRETRLVVVWENPSSVDVITEERWMTLRKRKPRKLEA